jgi:hypothetical protein
VTTPRRVELAGGDGGAQHVEPVQGGFGVDLSLSAPRREAGVSDVDVEVLAGLVLPDHLAHGDPDRPGAGESARGDASGDWGQELFGGGQQGRALAGAVGGQDRVAASDQPLSGVVRAGDFGQVLLVEQAHLQRPAIGHELFDRGGAQRGDPPVGAAGWRGAVACGVQRLDPGLGDHAAVADHDHPGQRELAADDRDDLGERVGSAVSTGTPAPPRACLRGR